MVSDDKPRLFIGSSTEHLDFAEALQLQLAREFEVTVWHQGVFKPSESTMESLVNHLEATDFGAFVLSPDDTVISRGRRTPGPRDNLLFELGLFAGRLGPKRAFILVPAEPKLKLPTDLAGITVIHYAPSRGNLQAAMGPAATAVKLRIRELSSEHQGRGAVVGMFQEFDTEMAALLSNASTCELVFVHSRRWRENHGPALQTFLSEKGTTLDAFLPNIENRLLLDELKEHFDDGPTIPALISDAYLFFADLAEKAVGKVTVRLQDRYPTYSLYRFGREFVLATYPLTGMKTSVPAIRGGVRHPMSEFISSDLSRLKTEAKVVSSVELRRLASPHLASKPAKNRRARAPSS